jgi:hypothetical protein
MRGTSKRSRVRKRTSEVTRSPRESSIYRDHQTSFKVSVALRAPAYVEGFSDPPATRLRKVMDESGAEPIRLVHRSFIHLRGILRCLAASTRPR